MLGTEPHSRMRHRAPWRVGGVAALAAVCLAAAQAGVAEAQPTTTTSFTTPGTSVFTVPAGVSSITATAIGGAGGACFVSGGETATVSGTLAVQPGQALTIGVAGPGGACAAGGGTGAGGVGGGGAGGTAGGGGTGGGGGGASSVSATGGSGLIPLLVAAGGGGTGALGGTGGNAGAAAPMGPFGTGGGAGTAAAGGAGGTDFSGANANGTAGTLGMGGAGGGGQIPAGGGGGGGGYFGGGGGAGTIAPPPTGGGGGSSFLGIATSPSGPTLTTAAASVTLTYATPTPPKITLSTTSLAFGHQAVGTVSPQMTITIGNTGTGPLNVAGFSTAGANPGDFLIADLCQQPVAPGATCQVGVRFAPQAKTSRTATLSVLSNDLTDPATIQLSGTGSRATNAGKGSPNGGGQQNTAGQVVCHKGADGMATCEIECAPGTYRTQSAKIPATFIVRQGGRVVDQGSLELRHGAVTRHRLRLKPGRYTLTIRTGTGTHSTVVALVHFTAP